MTKKTFLLVYFFLVAAGSIKEAPASPLPTTDEILSVAEQFFQYKIAAPGRVTMKIVHISVNNDDTLNFLCTPSGFDGFVIIGADRSKPPVVGYSLTGSALSHDLFDRLIQPAYAGKGGTLRRCGDAIHPQWRGFEAVCHEEGRVLAKMNSSAADQVSPLITTQWKQSDPYNRFCPVEIIGGAMPVGCLAVAVGQIMRYYSFPRHGRGVHQYTWNSQTLSADFGSEYYAWDNMPEKLDGSCPEKAITAVATLLYHIAVATETNFKPGGSPGFVRLRSLAEHFGYSGDYFGLDTAPADWRGARDKVLSEQLKRKIPVLFVATDTASRIEHAFVIDGKDNGGLFHINWGWGGDYDGYFSMDGLSPPGYCFAAGYGYTKWFAPDSELLAPDTLVAELVGNTVAIRWSKPEFDNGWSFYRLFRNGVIVADSMHDTAAIDSSIDFDRKYQYSIRSVDSSGFESSMTFSDSVCRWTSAGLPYSLDFSSNAKAWNLDGWIEKNRKFHVGNVFFMRTESSLTSPPITLEGDQPPRLIYAFEFNNVFPDDSTSNDTLFCEIAPWGTKQFKVLRQYTEKVPLRKDTVFIGEYIGKEVVVRFRYIGLESHNDDIPDGFIIGNELLYAEIISLSIIGSPTGTLNCRSVGSKKPFVRGSMVSIGPFTFQVDGKVEVFDLHGRLSREFDLHGYGPFTISLAGFASGYRLVRCSGIPGINIERIMFPAAY